MMLPAVELSFCSGSQPQGNGAIYLKAEIIIASSFIMALEFLHGICSSVYH